MKKIINNIYWLVLDRGLLIIIQFLVGVKIANHYGANIYGKYSLALSFIAFYPLVTDLVNERIIKMAFEEEKKKVIETINTFKLIISMLLLFLVLLFKSKFEDKEIFNMLCLLSMNSLLLNATYGIKSFFEYDLKSKITVKIDLYIRIVYSSLQYILIITNYSIVYVILIRVLLNIVRLIFFNVRYTLLYKEKLKLKIDYILLKKIIIESRYLWASTMIYILYSQIDKIMLSKLVGVSAVGIYNISLQWMTLMLIPLEIIRNSFHRYLFEIFKENYKKYLEKYLEINFYITQIYLFGGIISFLILPFVFVKVYSSEYNQAIPTFNALLIGILVRGNEVFQFTHYTFKKTTKYLMYKQVLGLVLNIVLNIIFIKKYQSVGAAFATSITLLFTRVIFDFFIVDLKDNFYIQVKSYNIFYIKKIFKDKKIKSEKR